MLARSAAELAALRSTRGMSALVASAQSLLADLFARELAPFYLRADALRPECLYPDPARVRPVALELEHAGSCATIPLSDAIVGDLASWMGRLRSGTRRPLSPVGGALFDALDDCGALTSEPRVADVVPAADLVFVGHATVASGRAGRLLFDPYLLPRSSDRPDGYQPLQGPDLGPLDAVFITHSHPDHFDPGTLLTLGADVPIHVPAVERESLLAIDMAARLEQLGFTKVVRVRPGERLAVGAAHVDVLPFFGEQPTTGDVLHPEVRNEGCTYRVTNGERSFLILADSGRDRTGDVCELMTAVQRMGGADLVFGGYRAFAVYPIHYLFSSVARFLLFVPPGEWRVRQKTMNDGSDLLDAAERCGARHVIPYADGGAPWYWERGLGPRLDGSGAVNFAVDPLPDEVVRLAAARSSGLDGPIASPVRVTIARPGQGLTLDGDELRPGHGPHQAWPFVRREWLQFNIALARAGGSALASARAVFAALAPAIAQWRDRGALSCCFFMRKPPDLRLRFLADRDLAAVVTPILDDLVATGAIVHHSPSVYEPEVERFGGEAAMAAVHAWFDHDTAAWLALDALRQAGDGPTALAVCHLVADDLARTTIIDRDELHGLWHSHARTLESAPDPFPALDAPAIPESLLADYRAANRILARTLLALRDEGTLTAGLRAVVQSVIMFHFHRHGLTPAEHASVTHALLAATAVR